MATTFPHFQHSLPNNIQWQRTVGLPGYFLGILASPISLQLAGTDLHNLLYHFDAAMTSDTARH